LLHARALQGRKLLFQLFNDDQSLVPAPFQLCGNQSVKGVYGIVLPSGQGGLVARLFELQFDMPVHVISGSLSRFDCLQRRFDTQGLQALQNLVADGFIHAQRAEGNTTAAAVGDFCAYAFIATYIPSRTAVGYSQLARAMTTAQQSGEQRFAAANRTLYLLTQHVGVLCDEVLIMLENLPRDIALMMLANQCPPLSLLVVTPVHDPFSALLQEGLRGRPTVGIGAGVDWIAQEVLHRLVHRQLPLHRTPLRAIVRVGNAQTLLSMPDQHLADAADFGEFAKHELDRHSQSSIGVLIEAAAAVANIPHGQSGVHLAPSGFELDSLLRSLAKGGQLHLRQCALHAQQKAIICVARIIDAVLVN